MTAVSFLILEIRSQLIEKHRFKKYIFSKLENEFFIFYREYANGIVDNNMKLNESYMDFIKSLSQEVKSTIYFLIKNIVHNEKIDNFSIDDYFSHGNRRDIQELSIADTVEFNKLYKFSYKI